jgi:FkbM family methyltransferase
MSLWSNIYHAIRTKPWLGRVALHAIPDIGWTIKVRDIGSMAINLRKNRSYWLRDPVESEKFVLGALQHLVHPGDVVFDVGANIGLHVRFLVQNFRAAKVVAFEPMSQNLGILQKNIRVGNCEQHVQVVQTALADFDGEAEFQIDNVSSASGTLGVITAGQACQARKQYGLAPLTEKVMVSRVDTLVEHEKIPIPRCIKVDVEGAEERLLRGARQTLSKYRPHLVIELHGAEAARKVVMLLLQAGYHIFGRLQTDSGCAYQEIGAADFSSIVEQYSLPACIASGNRELLKVHCDYGTAVADAEQTDGRRRLRIMRERRQTFLK